MTIGLAIVAMMSIGATTSSIRAMVITIAIRNDNDNNGNKNAIIIIIIIIAEHPVADLWFPTFSQSMLKCNERWIYNL